MRTAIAVIMPVLMAAFNSHGAGDTHRLGVSAGFPQMGAISYMFTPEDFMSLSFEGYVGTLLINGTCGGRIIWSRTATGISPRCYAGFSVVDQWFGESPDDPIGTTAYLWTGGGIGYNFPCGVCFYADIGYLGGGDRDKGLGYAGNPALNGGLLFSF